MSPSTSAEPPLPNNTRDADERATLTEMLDYYRAVLLRKAWGLDADGLSRRLGVSDLTLGGLILHMALVEDTWFNDRIDGSPPLEPWASMDWHSDPDYEIHTASEWTLDALVDQYQQSIERSRATLAAVDSLDQIVDAFRPEGSVPNVRWILVHMIEEYARHCGHADLLREAIDGTTGD